MQPETVKITLPLPPQCLSPNNPSFSRGGRIGKAMAAKKCRRLAGEAVSAEQIESGPWERATMQAHFFHKQKRRRDGVNHNAMCKAYQDGIIDAGLVVDDDSEHFTTLPPEFSIDRELSRVELTITRVL